MILLISEMIRGSHFRRNNGIEILIDTRSFFCLRKPALQGIVAFKKVEIKNDCLVIDYPVINDILRVIFESESELWFAYPLKKGREE